MHGREIPNFIFHKSVCICPFWESTDLRIILKIIKAAGLRVEFQLVKQIKLLISLVYKSFTCFLLTIEWPAFKNTRIRVWLRNQLTV
jgi:hypothetical protein